MKKKIFTIIVIALALILISPMVSRVITDSAGKASSEDSAIEDKNSHEANKKEEIEEGTSKDEIPEGNEEIDKSQETGDSDKDNTKSEKDSSKSTSENNSKSENNNKDDKPSKTNNSSTPSSNNKPSNIDSSKSNNNNNNKSQEKPKAEEGLKHTTEGHVETGMLAGTTYIAEGKVYVKNTNDILVLINKKRNLPSNYKPSDLVIPNVKFSFSGNDQKKYMRKEAAKALEELFAAAEKDGIYLYAVSGYRSYSRQKSLFDYRAARDGFEKANKLTAYPGQSEHQTGLAMDVSCQSLGFDLREQFAQTPEGIWLKDNAHKFGFIIRYFKGAEGITGYSYEPWHIRYVGKSAASEIHQRGITLEQYLGFIK